MLEQFSLSSSFATNGQAAIQMVKNRLDRDELHMFQLILCDFSMPEMNGFKCADAIRKLVT